MKARILSALIPFFLLGFSSLFGQMIGDEPLVTGFSRFNKNPLGGRLPIELGDTIGTFQFEGWLPAGKFQRTAGIRAIVTDAPTNSSLSSRLVFLTGGSALAERLTILENGFVGINTPTPSVHLHVEGDAFISGNLTVGGNFKVTGDLEAGRDVLAGRDVKAERNLEAKQDVKAGANVTAGENITAAGDLVAGDDLTVENDLFVKNGKVGIGVDPNSASATPGSHRLYIGGSMIAEEVKVELRATWPDYVFEPDFKLTPLPAIETFIKNHKHLPNIPSAAEVAQNGLPLGETQRLMMEKIEELYLHLIELEKQVKALKVENEALRAKIQK